MVQEYIASTVVDTIICMDGTDVIGAYLADELTNSGIMSMNAHGTIYVTTPEQASTGQLLFRDNTIPMIRNKHVLVLLATATTGHTLEKALECIEYYGGIVEGVSAIFTGTDEIHGHKINGIFHSKDVPEYTSHSSSDCPICKAGIKLDGIISEGGFTQL
jgi:orotate phosphoribosyltransferase